LTTKRLVQMHRGTFKDVVTVEIEVEIEYEYEPYQPASDYEEGRPLSPPVEEYLGIINVYSQWTLDEIDLERYVDKDRVLDSIHKRIGVSAFGNTTNRLLL